jgi:hypothetical protein
MLCGNGTEPIIDAAAEAQLPLIDTRNEQAASYLRRHLRPTDAPGGRLRRLKRHRAHQRDGRAAQCPLRRSTYVADHRRQ